MGAGIALFAGVLLAGIGLLYRTVDRAIRRRTGGTQAPTYGPVDFAPASIPFFLYGGLALILVGAVWWVVDRV